MDDTHLRPCDDVCMYWRSIYRHRMGGTKTRRKTSHAPRTVLCACVDTTTRHLLSANNLARTKEAYYCAKETHGVVHFCDHFLCTAFLFRAEL